jgi:hypothetical protein
MYLSLQAPHGCSPSHRVLRERHWSQEAHNIESRLDFIILAVVEIGRMEAIDGVNTLQKNTPQMFTPLLEKTGGQINETSRRQLHYTVAQQARLHFCGSSSGAMATILK